MTRAYNESYLNSAKERLALFFDYAINDCGFDADMVAAMFITSGYAKQFERGNPAVIAGMSGIELARAVIFRVYKEKALPSPAFVEEKTPEYWAGWALASYQWYSAKRFKDIFTFAPLSEILRLYSLHHEADISKFIETMNFFYEKSSQAAESKLKRIRENRGLSQSELAGQSGVNLRSIQMYEQKVNDIDKAQAQTLYKLARALGCEIEDLLENPME